MQGSQPLILAVNAAQKTERKTPNQNVQAKEDRTRYKYS